MNALHCGVLCWPEMVQVLFCQALRLDNVSIFARADYSPCVILAPIEVSPPLKRMLAGFCESSALKPLSNARTSSFDPCLGRWHTATHIGVDGTLMLQAKKHFFNFLSPSPLHLVSVFSFLKQNPQ